MDNDELGVPINMTVGNLKEILSTMPDDMNVVIPINSNIEDPNHIEGFRFIRTAGILSNPFETDQVLCLNTAADGLDISSQIKIYNGYTSCERVLF